MGWLKLLRQKLRNFTRLITCRHQLNDLLSVEWFIGSTTESENKRRWQWHLTKWFHRGFATIRKSKNWAFSRCPESFYWAWAHLSYPGSIYPHVLGPAPFNRPVFVTSKIIISLHKASNICLDPSAHENIIKVGTCPHIDEPYSWWQVSPTSFLKNMSTWLLLGKGTTPLISWADLWRSSWTVLIESPNIFSYDQLGFSNVNSQLSIFIHFLYRNSIHIIIIF